MNNRTLTKPRWLWVITLAALIVAFGLANSGYAQSNDSCVPGIVTFTFATNSTVEHGVVWGEERWWAFVWSHGTARLERITKEVAAAIITPAYWKC